MIHGLGILALSLGIPAMFGISMVAYHSHVTDGQLGVWAWVYGAALPIAVIALAAYAGVRKAPVWLVAGISGSGGRPVPRSGAVVPVLAAREPC